MALVRCPACAAELEVADEDLGGPVACGACGETFTAGAAGRPDRDDEDDDFDRPRRRRFSAAAAQAAVAGPALGLILTGWIGAALSLLGGIACVVLGFVNLDSGDAARRNDAPGLLAVGGALVVLGVPYFGLIAVGGHRMKRLDGTVWVYTSAVLGIATIALCGPCNPITWAGVAVGIWAIIAVSKTGVKDVIEANREGGPPRDDEDEDR